MFDRHSRRKARNWAIGVFGPPVTRVWTATLRTRWSSVDFDVRDGRIVIPEVVALVWHQRLFTLTTRFAGAGITTLVSRHADGEMLARVIDGIGHHAVRGSTTRGGVQAIRELVERSTEPVRFAITPDGPRGPPYVLQSGAVYLASRTGLPLCLSTVGLDRPWQLPSWDRFWLPRPFSRALIRIGRRIHVPPDLDRDELERFRADVEAELRAWTEETDRDFDALWDAAHAWRGFEIGGRERTGAESHEAES